MTSDRLKEPSRRLTIVLLVDEQSASNTASALLAGAGITFLTVKAPDVTGSEPPALFIDQKRIQGVEEIRRYVKDYLQNQSRQLTNRDELDVTLAALHVLEIAPTLDSFDNRLIVQKAVYLLQSFGLSTKWDYFWYLRGPYSAELTNALFEIPSNRRVGDGGKLDSHDRAAIGKLLSYLVPSSMSPDDLEAAATIMFIARKERHSRSSRARLAYAVTNYKPKLPKRTVNEYTKILWPFIIGMTE